jgi:hypothetical protein
MSETVRDSVAITGADAGDVLMGSPNRFMNQGLLIKIFERQTHDGGRVTGPIELISAGGTYAEVLSKFVQKERYDSVKALLDQVRFSGGEAAKCSHVFNKNSLLRLRLVERTEGWVLDTTPS